MLGANSKNKDNNDGSSGPPTAGGVQAGGGPTYPTPLPPQPQQQQLLATQFANTPPPPPSTFSPYGGVGGMALGGMVLGGGSRSDKAITAIPQDGKDTDELAAVVVTIRNDATYDDLFTKVKQKAAEGTRVSCYLVCNYEARELQALVEGSEEHGAQLRADIAAAAPTSVVFNWECCGGCTGDRFRGGDPNAFMASLLAKGYMVMVSDFSLGALIHHWDASALGANPFKLVGEFADQLTLCFQPSSLAACEDSAQLQMLGELCATGTAHVHALGGTKAYMVDSTVAPASHPSEAGWNQLEVLTVVTRLGGAQATSFAAEELLCAVGEHRGLAGHVVLRYPSGGRLLTSCPHWIELSKLDVNAEQLLRVAEARYGEGYASGMRQAMAGFGDDEAGKSTAKRLRLVERVHVRAAVRAGTVLCSSAAAASPTAANEEIGGGRG